MVALLLLILFESAFASKPSLIINIPSNGKPPAKKLIILDDENKADFRLSAAKADSGKVEAKLILINFSGSESKEFAVVGFDESRNRFGIPTPVWQGAIPDQGKDLTIIASKIKEGVTYNGTLTAIIQNKVIDLKLSILRPRVMPVFEGPENDLVISADGKVTVPVMNNIPKNKPVDVSMTMSPFRSDKEEIATVIFDEKRKPDGTPQYELTMGKVKDDFSVKLAAADLIEGTKYKGKLFIIVKKNNADITKQTIDLNLLYPKQPASTLVADPKIIIKNIQLPICESYPIPFCTPGWQHPVSQSKLNQPISPEDLREPLLTIHLRDKALKRRVSGITMRLEGTSSAPQGTFDLARHTESFIEKNGKEHLVDLGVWPPQNETSRKLRTLERGQQAEVALMLKELGAGEYKFDLRFAAINSIDTDHQKVSVSLKVKHHWIGAFILLILSLIFSYVLSKGIVNWRDRTKTRSRIERLQKTWPKAFNPQPWNVWARAVFAQCMQLVRKPLILPPAPSIAENLKRIERLESIAHRQFEILDDLQDFTESDRIKHHIRIALEVAMDDLEPERLDEEKAKAILAKLDDVSRWIEDPNTRYWTKITAEAKRLVEEVEALNFAENFPSAEKTVEQLLTDLKNPPTQPTDSQKHKFDDDYWRLRLFYERRRRQEDINALKEAMKKSAKMEDFFFAADLSVWTTMETLKADSKLKIIPNDDDPSPQPREMLRPIEFSLYFDEPMIAETFLIRFGTEYEWHFQLDNPKRKEPIEWKVISKGPRVTQYAPGEGDLSVKILKIRWPKRSEIKELTLGSNKALAIEGNHELKLSNNIVASEVVLLILIALFALGGGMLKFYCTTPTFGSFSDYMGLAVWAIGLDQGKNLIQSLKTYANPSG
jgi:hypothetical protein